MIGGGIAGPVTALALTKAGIQATVYEAHPAAADGVGAMLSLAPNGLDALQTIGADKAVQAIGQPVPRVVMADGSGTQLAAFGGFPGLPATLAMARADLFRALADHAMAGGVPIHYGKRLLTADEAPGGVTATFADGTTATAEVLVGADGIRSTVRALIDPDAPGPAYQGVLSFGGYAAGGGVPAEPGTMYFAFGRSFIGYWRLPDDRICWFASLPRTQPLTPPRSAVSPPPTGWRSCATGTQAHVPGETLLAHADPQTLMAVGPMERMPSVPHWHRGRMVLVGDSAHAPSSSSGQGASQAIESAIELARCLRDLPTPAAAFTAYQRLRRRRVEMIGGNAAATNRAKAGQAGDRPAMPTPEQLFVAPSTATTSTGTRPCSPTTTSWASDPARSGHHLVTTATGRRSAGTRTAGGGCGGSGGCHARPPR